MRRGRFSLIWILPQPYHSYHCVCEGRGGGGGEAGAGGGGEKDGTKWCGGVGGGGRKRWNKMVCGNEPSA